MLDNSIYAQMVRERGYDPLQFPVRSHRQFMEDQNQQGWLGFTTLKVERGWRTFKPSLDKKRKLLPVPTETA